MLLNQIYASIDCFRFINQIDEKKKNGKKLAFQNKTKQNRPWNHLFRILDKSHGIFRMAKRKKVIH